MSRRSDLLVVAREALRLAAEAEPTLAGELSPAADVLEEQLKPTSRTSRPSLPPKTAADILGMSASQMRRLSEQDGVAERRGGRIYVRGDWIVGEWSRRLRARSDPL